MRNAYILSALLICCSLFAQTSAVGIGTTNPQQKLHLDKSVGTVRVESLSKDNNPFNGGNIDPTGTYPLYVDSNGVLTLALNTFENSDGSDAIDHTNIPTASLTMTAADADGKVDGTILTYTVSVPRQAILEIKYSISYEIYHNNASLKIRDAGARRITTYYTVDNLPRKYGQASKSYMSYNKNNPAPYAATDRLCAVGQMYNTSTTYVQLSAGTHTISLKGEISSNLPSLPTHVKYAVDTDSLFMRLY